MESLSYVLTYVKSCASGALPLNDCGPAWQMLVIVVLLSLAISALVVLRIRSHMPTSAV